MKKNWTDEANRLTSKNGTTYQYDNNGNLTSDGTRSFSYDEENRLIEVRENAAVLAAYTYDIFGNRMSKSVSGETAYYLYDEEDIVGIFDPAGNALASLTHGPGIDEPLVMMRGGQSYFYHTDGLGSIVALTDSTASVVERYRHASFGQPTITDASGSPLFSSAFGNPYTFTGREYDGESRLDYYRRRYYDPRLGRFLSRDPVYGGNLYAYVRNNAINIPDPWGLRPGDKYRSQDEAASNALSDILKRSIREDAEYAGWVYRNSDGTYSYSPTNKGTAHSSQPGPKPQNGTAFYHTHGAESGPRYDDENFSPADISFGRAHGVDGYLGAPSGKQLRYDTPLGKVEPIDRADKTGLQEGLAKQVCKRGKEAP